MSFNTRVHQGLNTRTIPKPLPKPEKKANNFQGRTYKVVTMSKQDEQSMKSQLKVIHENDRYLMKLENQLAELDRKNAKAIISESILGISIDTMNDIPKEKIDLISFNSNNNLIISDVGMRDVVIPLAIKYSIKEICFATIRDKNNTPIEIQIQSEALKILLKAIPETKISKITLMEARVLLLTNDERELVVNLSRNHHIEFEQI